MGCEKLIGEDTLGKAVAPAVRTDIVACAGNFEHRIGIGLRERAQDTGDTI